MKHLPLKAVMTGLEIIETDEGYELHSPAGEAKYDAWGSRREVNGIPEYFPSSISMKKREPAATGDNKNYKSGFEIAIDAGDAAKAIDEIDKHICNGDAFKKLKNGWSFEKDGTLIINNGQVFITDAKISNAMLSDASIEKAKFGNALASNNGSISTTYVMKMGVGRGNDENVEAILKNALKNAAQSAAQDGAKRAAEDLKSKTKDIQLAMLYNGDHFYGFGLAVDGQLLSDQLDAKILQSVGCQAPAELQVTFRIKEKSTGKPIRIDLAELRNSRGW